jgi:hypothetical protein
MKASFDKYLNEIVGLTIMALMTVALIAGQANVGLQGVERADGPGLVEIRLTVKD